MLTRAQKRKRDQQQHDRASADEKEERVAQQPKSQEGTSAPKRQKTQPSTDEQCRQEEQRGLELKLGKLNQRRTVDDISGQDIAQLFKSMYAGDKLAQNLIKKGWRARRTTTA
jgi:hypothetical protein